MNPPIADFSADGVQELVVGVAGDLIDLLNREPKSHGEDAWPGAQRGEGAVIIAAALPKTGAKAIKGEQGRQDYVWRGLGGVWAWRQNTRGVGNVGRGIGRLAKTQGGAGRDNHGKQDHGARRGQSGDERGRVQLRAHGAVAGDLERRARARGGEKVCNSAGGPRPRVLRQLSATGAHEISQRGLGPGHLQESQKG